MTELLFRWNAALVTSSGRYVTLWLPLVVAETRR